MKTIITTIILIAITLTASAQATTNQYQQAMTSAVSSLKKQPETPSVPNVLALANQFERIAGAEPAEWLPRYYAGLMYVYLGFMGKDAAEKDKFLDLADRYVAEADKLAPDNDEITVLKAYVAQSRMTVDPMNRWQTYGPQFESAIEKAMTQNAANPRPYVLKGLGLMYTPEEFGGGPKTGCPLLKKATEKLATFKPASDLSPSWGDTHIAPVMEKCK